MPQRPLKICATAGCKTLTRQPHCDAHAEQAAQEKEERKRAHDKKRDAVRGSSTQRGYNSEWRAASKEFLAAHPLCLRHLRYWQQHVKATVVDHITPHKGDKVKFWDRNNWQPLCKSCHDQKTRAEDYVRPSA